MMQETREHGMVKKQNRPLFGGDRPGFSPACRLAVSMADEIGGLFRLLAPRRNVSG